MSITSRGVKFTHRPKGIIALAVFTLVEYILTTIFFISLSADIWYPERAQAAQGISKILSYQGRLTDANSNPLGGSGTNYCFRFSIYNAASGGTQVWPAGTPSSNTISVVNGVFNAGIGQADDLGTFNFYDNYDTGIYLNIEVNDTPNTCTGSWETLLPRQQINAVGYARAAQDVYGDLLRTLNSANPPRVQIGTGAGASTPVYLSLDVKNDGSETIGGIRVLGIDQLVDQFYRFERPLTTVEIETVFRDVSRAFPPAEFRTPAARWWPAARAPCCPERRPAFARNRLE